MNVRRRTVRQTDLSVFMFADNEANRSRIADNVLTLKSKLPPANDIYSTEIPFSVIGNKAVMSIKAVPATGSFKAAKENK